MSAIIYPQKLVDEFPYLDPAKLTRRMVIHFLVALSFPAMAGFYFFGFAMIRALVVCISVAVLVEYLCNLLMKKASTVHDLTAVATGAVIAMNMRPGLGIYPLILASAIGIMVGKVIFGGVGFNPVNPAVVGRLVPVAGFPGLWAMSIRPTIPTLMEKAGLSYWEAVQYNLVQNPKTLPFYTKVLSSQPAYVPYSFSDKLNTNYDVLSGTSYLETVKNWYKSGVMPESINVPSEFFDYWTLFVGNFPGTLGETAKWAILLGFLYLVVTKIISPVIPVLIWILMALFGWVFSAVNLGPAGIGPLGFFHGDPMIWLLAGGAMLGSVYMETDPVSSPRTLKAKVLYSIFFVAVVTSIRMVFSFPEGVSFALLSSNLIMPFFDQLCDPKHKHAKLIDRSLKFAGVFSIFLLFGLGIYENVIKLSPHDQNIKHALVDRPFKKTTHERSESQKINYYTVFDTNNNLIGYALNVFDEENLGDLIFSTLIFQKDNLVGFYIKDSHHKSDYISNLVPNDDFQHQFIGKSIDEIFNTTSFIESETEFTLKMAKSLIKKGYEQYRKIDDTVAKK
ncbi:MAG: RnfABCDGE type electron transport complex subunit D [Brevinema sp.]